MLTTVLFYLFAAVLVGAAVGVITARNPVHSALFLVLAFFNSAALWLLLEAEFLGIALVLVYVGAVMVLFLFVVMMLDINVAKLREGFARHAPLGALVAGIMVFEMFQVYLVRDLGKPGLLEGAPRAATPEGLSNTEALGQLLFTQYAYAFQLAGVVLLLAIVAAIALTMRKRPGLKAQDVSRQVAVTKAERLRIVKMDAEKRP
ncbi:MAG: NADH-quinone oxidoreductase subunit J [Gammaproteobacteria bacterium]